MPGFSSTRTLRLHTDHKPAAPVGEAAFWDRAQVVPLEPWVRLSGMRRMEASS